MGGLFDPLYHESVCRIYRTRFPKIHDFVPFGICQEPVKPLLRFFSKKFKIFDVEIFWGSSSIRKISKKIEKFFLKKNPKIWNPYGLRISHIKFEWNRRQKKNFFPKFFHFFLMLEDPQKILTSKISNFLEKNFRSSFTGSWQIPKGTKSWILVNLVLVL